MKRITTKEILCGIPCMLLLLIVLGGSFNLAFATNTVTITGQATAAGTTPPAPVAGAEIVLVPPPHSGMRMTTVTDGNGNFSFTVRSVRRRLQPGGEIRSWSLLSLF